MAEKPIERFRRLAMERCELMDQLQAIDDEIENIKAFLADPESKAEAHRKARDKIGHLRRRRAGVMSDKVRMDVEVEAARMAWREDLEYE